MQKKAQNVKRGKEGLLRVQKKKPRHHVGAIL